MQAITRAGYLDGKYISRDVPRGRDRARQRAGSLGVRRRDRLLRACAGRRGARQVGGHLSGGGTRREAAELPRPRQADDLVPPGGGEAGRSLPRRLRVVAARPLCGSRDPRAQPACSTRSTSGSRPCSSGPRCARPDLLDQIRGLLDDPTAARADALNAAVSEVVGIELTIEEAASRFTEQTEWSWRDGRPPLDES